MLLLGLVEVPLWFLLTIAIVTGLYLLGTKNHDYYKKRGIPGPKPLPFLGTIYTMFSMDFHTMHLELKKQYGKTYGMMSGSKPEYVIFDADMISEVTVKQFHNFTDRREAPVGEPAFDSMITALQGDHWKHVRSQMSPAFTTGAFTMDVIASTGFGLRINSQEDENNAFVTNGKKMVDFDLTNIIVIFFFLLPQAVPYLTKMGFQFKEKSSPNDKESRADFIQLMVKAKQGHDIRDKEDEDKEAGNKPFTKESGHRNQRSLLRLKAKALPLSEGEAVGFHLLKTNLMTKQASTILQGFGLRLQADAVPLSGLSKGEILSNALLFFIAGFDTTSVAVSQLMYLLACNQDCQQRLIEELDRVLGDKETMNYDSTLKLPYLDQCIQECLRLYPPGVIIDRKAKADTEVCGVKIEKDSVVTIPIIGIHHDPEIWPDPERFDPERFSPENKPKISPFHFMPFGSGPRNCIGLRLALFEIKVAIGTILRTHKLVTCDRTEIPLIMSKSKPMKPENGVWLELERRTSS